AQLELKQKLDFVAKGLSARAMAYTKRYAYFSVSRQYDPFFYTASEVDGVGINITAFNHGGPGSIGVTGTEYLNYREGPKIVNTSFYAEGSINYARDFKEHAVSGMLIGIMNNYLTGNAGDLQASLPHRNLGLSGRFTYGYDTRYLMEFNFGLN